MSSENSYREDDEQEENNGRDIPPAIFSSEKREYKRSQSIADFFGKSGDEFDAVRSVDPNAKAGAIIEAKIHDEPNKSPGNFRYNMNHKNRGHFVIFNHEKFDIDGASKRHGTDRDRDNLEGVAKKLGFDVSTYDDLTHDKVVGKIKKFAAKDHTDNDCFACAVLTHGEEGDILLAKDGRYHILELLVPIRDCPTLRGKPKLFFIQACRGTKLDSGAKFDNTDAVKSEKTSSDTDYQLIPIEADFFIGYSTVDGYYAWRNGERGSWFIQALCFCLEEYSETLELMQIMTRVNRMVAYDFESNVGNSKKNANLNNKKQMPCGITRLTRDVYFCPTKTTVSTETTEGEISNATGDDEVDLHSPKVKNQQSRNTDLIKAKLELVSISKKKLALKIEEQELLQKIYQHELDAM